MLNDTSEVAFHYFPPLEYEYLDWHDTFEKLPQKERMLTVWCFKQTVCPTACFAS